MEVQFRTRQLEICYQQHRQANRKYGAQVARKYIQRINIIQQAIDLAEIMRLPGLRCHALTGNRQGQYAINLTGYYRLIFTLTGNQLEVIMIEEVSKHYDD